MEFIRPMPTWEHFHQSEQARETFRALRTPGVGESLILEGNLFVERILPGSTVRELSDEELDVYRAPFVAPSTRLPMLQLPRELPIAQGAAFRASVPNVEVLQLSSGRHYLQEDHPKEIGDAVAVFIQKYAR
jgi:haloalkane dehalogenase